MVQKIEGIHYPELAKRLGPVGGGRNYRLARFAILASPPIESVRTDVSFQATLRETLHKAGKLRRVLAEPSYRQALLRGGVAATTEHEKVVFPREYRTVIDVGANRGQFALFARRRFPDAELFCFEPLPEAHRKLTEVVGRDQGVRLEQCAIGAVEGSMSLNVSRSDDSSSLLRPTSLQLRTFPKTDAVSSINVNTKTLDGAIDTERLRPPFLLKIDVQGFELEVIRGAERLLGQDGDLLVESSFAELYDGQALADELVAALLAQGYRLRGISSLTKGLDGSPLQADFLFAREVVAPVVV
jgi:FkbM family methyltransferase